MPSLTGSDLQKLQRAANKRKTRAYRPGTVANRRSQMSLFISFCIHFALEYISPSAGTLCLYAEFLARSFTAPQTIRNYISGIRFCHKYLDIDCPALHSFELDLMLRALDLTMRHIPNQRLPIDNAILVKLCYVCDYLGDLGRVLKVAFLFGYYGFLRQSNLAPRQAAIFDPKRHTCRGDIVQCPPGLVIILKWTKTIQRGQHIPMIPLPSVTGSPLCPCSAYRQMLQVCPTRSPNDPLLLLPGPGKVRKTLTSCQISRAFQACMLTLGYPDKAYSLHSLRAGGATAAYTAGVDYVHIKRHGTWRSDSFWSYVSTSNIHKSPVARALAVMAKTNTRVS